MTVSDDEDDAQRQIQKDAKLALDLQCEANIEYAVARREETTKAQSDQPIEVATSLISSVSEAGLQEQGGYKEEDSSTSESVTAFFETAAEENEEEYSDESYSLVNYMSSDISSAVLVDQDKKSTSPILTSDEDVMPAAGARPSGISYAAAASQGGTGVESVGAVSSVPDVLPDSGTEDTPFTSTSGDAFKGVTPAYFYSILHPDRGDAVFQALLGEYGDSDPLPVNLMPPNGRGTINNITFNPTALSIAVRNASMQQATSDPKLQLERVIGGGQKPQYDRIPDLTGDIRDRKWESVVRHPADNTVFAIGSGKNLLESERDAARKALESLLTGKDVAERARKLTISFRAAAAKLPFCLRFQLERFILSESSQLRLKRRPRGLNAGEIEQQKESLVCAARKMMIVCIQVILPPLLDIDWEVECGGKEYFTLVELFAEDIWKSLVDVKKAVANGSRVDTFASGVQSALDRARRSLKRAEKACEEATEAILTHPESAQLSYIETIRKRSIWPVATYSCKFDWEGQLVPTDYQVHNRDIEKGAFIQPQTRRAMREAGWPVRDRFTSMSSVKFHPVFQRNLIDWLGKNPTLCNREYVYLFDKGAGKPNVWLYSPPPECSGLSRDALLESLGCFDGVAECKLGDRISLAFTQTTPIDEVPLECIVAVPELETNGYRFSDGCGVMGLGIARKVQKWMKLPKVPGAIQIRMGGVKGMLSYKCDFPSDSIGIRPSMVKFRSNHRVLEVKQVSFVNTDPPLFSQMILVLHHGCGEIANRSLLQLQARACAEMAMEYDDEVDDIDDAYAYTRNVVKHGRKWSGLPFSPREFEDLKSKMDDAKTRVNLRCSVVMLYGVVDEHGILEEGEVLVCNGEIQGPVLISRSPCLMPGDIQKAYAISGRCEQVDFGEKYSKLDSAVVFSSKGDRPLPDMLGGGDLDGDQFYIVHEKALVDAFQPTDAHDYGSQMAEVDSRFDVNEKFSVADAIAPSLSCQLNVLRKLMTLGDIVAFSSEAWYRVADVEGPGSDRAIDLADLHHQSLDARKLALQVDKDHMTTMTTSLRKYDAPHWRSNGMKVRQSGSILGILFNIWKTWIRDLEFASKRRLRDYHGDAAGFLREPEAETDTVVSSESQCIVCFATGTIQCNLCGGTVWTCSEECEQRHHNEAGHPGGSRALLDEDSIVESTYLPANRFSLIPSAMEALLNVTFGRTHPSLSDLKPIDYRVLTETDLNTLFNMVLIGYDLSLRESKDGKRRASSNESPHENDVFLLDNGELAVCRRDANGGLMWFDKDQTPMHIDEVLYNRRVESLSGPCRVLESLLVKPTPGSLMEKAMKRDVATVTANADKMASLGSPNLAYLNESQRRVVQAALSMQSGILAVQGPPGCGKTSTIVEIVSVVGKGVILVAPSNAAVANLARKLLSTGQFDIRDIVVWGDNCDESVHFLNPVLRHKRWINFWRQYQNIDDDAEKKRKLLDFASWLQVDTNDSVRLLTKLSTLARLPAEDFTGQKAMADAKVLLCTLNTAGSLKLRSAVQHKFDLILFDEASQAPEAEFYIIATFPGVKRIVVVGDPRQLPATVVHEGCRDAGYAKSFLSNVLEYYPDRVHLLDVQYRMHPKILQFSNETFYSNRIFTDESVINRKTLVKSPFVVVDTSGIGSDVEQMVHTSWKNECEAVVIKSILCNDKDIHRVQSQVVGARTIVITPYDAQARFLRRELKKIKSLRSWDVATVDSFQGQEGDIVVVSTVKTSSAGFVDDPNRLNVALTRAKRVLRVVGNMTFFKQMSTLRQLAKFAEQNNIIEGSPVSAAWKPPDWTAKTAWKPTMTSRFHHSLGQMKRMDRNVAFNTVLAVSTPRLAELTSWPVEKESPRWQSSSLRQYEESLKVVWIAKKFEEDGLTQADERYVGIVEAHFAGGRRECLKFIQEHHLVPRNACGVKRDMSGIAVRSRDQAATHSTEIDLSWEITNDIQDAVVDDTIEELPDGLFLLDEYQESIIALRPPLLLESRSGMGKTEILFKHCLKFRPTGATSRTCFVTVSANLCRTLERRYMEVQEVEQVELPRVQFFSFLGSRVQTEAGTESVRSFIDLLLNICNLSDSGMSVRSSCTFLDYMNSRTSHERLEVDSSLVENEIGGVILGSLAAARKAAALKQEPLWLSRSEYLEEKRSNVPNDTLEGNKTREMVYDEYEKYRQWKTNGSAYDTNDIVLLLIREVYRTGANEIFRAVYLDEVQDFSYASIYLICSIAGKTEKRWTAAGDTAQMISPGCSFKFKGMKDTLLAIRGDVDLRKEVKLKRNYRMNKGTLEMANAIIDVIKQNFPGAIESYVKEESMKDLGLKVALLHWDEAEVETASLGLQQAVVYSSDTRPDAVSQSMNKWLNDHPFILSSLDSKGLEFDDVIVAFDFERKTWNVSAKRIASLRMCRELYVAVTRARRRVVILLKRNVDTMMTFFEALDCELEMTAANVILQEFEKETTAEQWFERGTQMLEEEQYKLAASCFNAASSFGWSAYAQGRYLRFQAGKKDDAKVLYRTAAKTFFESRQFKKCLDVLSELADFGQSWDDSDNGILDAALKEEPHHLPREQTVVFALVRGSWNTISVEDLKEYELFQEHRGDSNLKKMIQNCSEKDRSAIEEKLPLVIGDYCFDNGRYADATKLFLRGKDVEAAVKTTEVAMKNAHQDLPRITTSWRRSERARRTLAERNPTLSLLVSLFESPREAAAKHGRACMDSFGRSIVKLAVDNTDDADVEELHSFSRTEFESEILTALTERYRETPIDVVHWYVARDDKKQALEFAKKHLTIWAQDDLLGVILSVMKDEESRDQLIAELSRRNLLVVTTKLCLSGSSFDLSFAKKASDKALASVEMASKNAESLVAIYNTRRNDNRVASFFEKEVNSSPTALLWLLFSDPESAARRFGKQCMQVFGKDVVRRAVLKTKGSDKGAAYSTLCRFDKNAFASDKPAEPKSKAQDARATRQGADTSRRGGKRPNVKPEHGRSTEGEFDKLQKGDRIVVTGLIENARLNGQPGTVNGVKTSGSYLVTLDSDKPRAKKHSLHPRNLVREVIPSDGDSSSDSKPPAMMKRGQGRRSNGSGSSDSDSSDDSSDSPTMKKAPIGMKRPVSRVSQQQQHASDSDDGSMPDLFEEGNQSSSSDEEADLPDLESNASSVESSDSEGAIPTAKQNVGKRTTRSVRTDQVDDADSLDDDSVPPLQKRSQVRGHDDSSDSSGNGVPSLLSGGSSSDDSSAPSLEQPREARDSSDSDDTESSLEMPGLEEPRGDTSSDEESSGSSINPPGLISRPAEQDSSDSSILSDDGMPELMNRDRRATSFPETRPRQEQNQQQPSPPPLQQQPTSSTGQRRRGNRRKGRRGKGGRGKK